MRQKSFTGFCTFQKILDADIGNIRSLAINAVRNHPSAQVVDAVLEISKIFLSDKSLHRALMRSFTVRKADRISY